VNVEFTAVNQLRFELLCLPEAVVRIGSLTGLGSNGGNQGSTQQANNGSVLTSCVMVANGHSLDCPNDVISKGVLDVIQHSEC
jgi:hypothetical protein